MELELTTVLLLFIAIQMAIIFIVDRHHKQRYNRMKYRFVKYLQKLDPDEDYKDKLAK